MVKRECPRTEFKQDLLYSLGSARTICRIERNEAEKRFRAILEGKKDPGYAKEGGGIIELDENEENVATDVEQIASDQIMSHVEQQFKGHDLARLVNSVLQAEGYVTEISTPGPDGGVDILAGRGTLGFESPKLCVQVKSSQAPADVTILRSLQGTMQNFKADQGLLVSWGGFNKAVDKEARLSFFSVRLWDA
ncbi:MAG: restriction endonuclease, partial [Methanosarcinaceae archaeon]|nr:restriction endonuclease [Methanosarcinaceae archaeon]